MKLQNAIGFFLAPISRGQTKNNTTTNNKKGSFSNKTKIKTTNEPREVTHKRSFEHVLGHQHLVGGIGHAGLDRASLDLDHAVDAGHEYNEEGPGHGREHDRAPPALDPIQGYDHDLSQRGLEEKGQNECHFGQDHGVQELYHPLYS